MIKIANFHEIFNELQVKICFTAVIVAAPKLTVPVLLGSGAMNLGFATWKNRQGILKGVHKAKEWV